MGITHSSVVVTPDDADYEVGSDEWNDDHVVPATGFALGSSGPTFSSGADDPEGTLTAPTGSVYIRTTGALYVKTSGSGDTGWSEVVTYG